MRNPYIVEGESPTLKPSVLTFMDILGYSDLISKKSSNEELQKLHRAMTEGRDWLEGKATSKALDGFIKKDIYALKAFTDNIVIGWPIRSDGESEFGSAFFKLAYFQMQMVLEGYFIRGAISFGEAYVDEIAVFGPALIEAYKGEASLARDPRIILTNSSISEVEKHISYYLDRNWSPQSNHLLRDSDGQWFLNYLDVVIPDTDIFLSDELLKHKTAVEEALSKYSRDPKIWSKYTWVARYHNYFCELHHHYFGNDFDIEISKFEAKPSPI